MATCLLEIFANRISRHNSRRGSFYGSREVGERTTSRMVGFNKTSFLVALRPPCAGVTKIIGFGVTRSERTAKYFSKRMLTLTPNVRAFEARLSSELYQHLYRNILESLAQTESAKIKEKD